ncbi:hypothetical protein BAE44_0000536, partial [Dichanthelium oligosanthes]
LRELRLYELTNLTSVENFPSFVELDVFDCPELKRISGLSRLHKIRILRCPNVEVEETGHRLSNYASQFGVPFRFHGIAAWWETITIDDLDIDPDEPNGAEPEQSGKMVEKMVFERSGYSVMTANSHSLERSRSKKLLRKDSDFADGRTSLGDFCSLHKASTNSCYLQYLPNRQHTQSFDLYHALLPTMAAMPEEVQDRHGLLDVADLELFSPFVFLDLPPMLCPDGEDPASSDDLVLPFILMMLMEEDIDVLTPEFGLVQAAAQRVKESAQGRRQN